MGSGVPAAEVQDLPVSQSVEILHPQIGASAVVHRYVALGLIPQILAEKHRRDLLQQRGDLLIGGRGLGDDQNPVHPAAQQQFDHHLLLFQIRLRVAQHNVVAPGPGAHLHIIGQLGHELIFNGRHYQSQQIRLFHHHGAGHVVPRVPHLVAQADNPLPRALSDLVTPRQSPGYRCIRDTGGLGHILQCHVLHDLCPFHRSMPEPVPLRKRFHFDAVKIKRIVNFTFLIEQHIELYQTCQYL